MNNVIHKSFTSFMTYFFLLCVVFCVALDISIIGPLFPILGDEFDVPISSLSKLLSFFVFFGIVSSPIITLLADYKGRKFTFISIIILFAISTLAVGYAQTLSELFVARIFQGIASGGIFPISVSIIHTELNPNRRGLLLGLLGASFGVAFLVGPLIAGLLIDNDWRLIFKIQGIVILIFSFVFIFILRSIKKMSSGKIIWKQIILFIFTLSSFFASLILIQQFFVTFNFAMLLAGIVGAIAAFACFYRFKNLITSSKSSQFYFYYLIQPATKPIILVALLAGIYESSLIFLPSMMVISMLLEPSQASFMMIPLVIAMIIGSALWGYLLDRSNPFIIITSGMILSLIFISGLALSAHNTVLFLLFGSLLGFSLSAFIGTPLRYLLMDIYPNNFSSSIQGLLSFLQGTGRLVGATLFGGLITFYNDDLPGYQLCLFLCGLLSLVALKYFYKNKGYLDKEALK